MNPISKSTNLSNTKQSIEQKSLSFELFSNQELTTFIEKLNSICQHLDPYHPLSDKDSLALLELGIAKHDDPFELTNNLVKMLEDAIEEKMSRENKNNSLQESQYLQ